jgi:quercetin dioxygenase-like cupin family protein
MTERIDHSGNSARPIPGTMDTTSGSDDRESRALRDPLMRFDLAREIDRLTSEREWNEGDRNSIVLAKDAQQRILLTVMRSGARVGDEEAEGQIAIQVLGGRVVARRDAHSTELGDGELATVAPGGRWAVEAVEDSAILLTLARDPDTAGV